MQILESGSSWCDAEVNILDVDLVPQADATGCKKLMSNAYLRAKCDLIDARKGPCNIKFSKHDDM